MRQIPRHRAPQEAAYHRDRRYIGGPSCSACEAEGIQEQRKIRTRTRRRIMEPADRGRSRSERKRANIICYGKKGHYNHECRSPRKQEKGGRTQNTASTSGSNAHASNGHGGNAPANKLNPSKPSGGSLLCLMEPGEIAYSASADGRAHHYIDTAASSHSLEEIGALYDYVPFEVPDRLLWPRTIPSKPSAQ